MNMIEVKTADLSGAALDWAVALADGIQVYPSASSGGVVTCWLKEKAKQQYSPSTRWRQGGPLIEKFRAYPMRYDDTAGVTESNRFFVMTEMEVLKFGDVFDVIEGQTPLVAACRSIVAAKLGDTVQVPAELLP